MTIPHNGDPRVYMAAERTFLAWIRTGVALIGFGFVVARFGLFLREIGGPGASLPEVRLGLSLPVGIALVLLGILVTGGATLRHRRYVKALRDGEFTSQFHSRFPFIVATLLVVVGTIMAGYLALI
jgi:putative membrane protein